MKTKLIKTISVRIAAFALLSGCMYADSMEWVGNWAGVWSGFGTSPYTAYDATLGKDITIFCLDFNDEIAPPYAWNANIYALNPTNVTNNAQFGGNYGHGVQAPPNPAAFAFQGDTAGSYSVDMTASPDAYTRYLEAAWLFSNIQKAGSGDLNNEIISQVAAWELFVDSNHIGTLHTDIQSTSGTYTFNNYLYSVNHYGSISTASTSGLSFEQAVIEALSAAEQAVTAENWAGSAFMGTWDLVTADPTWVGTLGNNKPAQEFLTPIANPEPGAIVLLGSAILLIAATQWKRLAARLARPDIQS
ncbi:MAG TPA: hypothetical protein VMS37_03000 [Verrucomicrobiae bacterium]|nr:hypothetical protein [Verrucomicrobiae bacterium]